MGPTTSPRAMQDAHINKLGLGIVPRDHSDAVKWLYDYAVSNKLSNEDVGRKIGYDTSNISRIYMLDYNNGKVGKVVDAIKKLQIEVEIEHERAKYGDIGFIETKLSKAIADACYAARVSQTMAMISGESQTGKTAALKQVAGQSRHGPTYYIEINEAMSKYGFLRELAEVCNVPRVSNNYHVYKSIIEAISPNALLIADEVHQPFSTGKYRTGAQIIELLRGIFNTVGCGVVMCGTNALRDEIAVGRLSKVLAQTRKRGIIKVQCPDVLPLSDIWKFTSAYGLPRPVVGSPEYELISRINRTNGISEVTKYLKAGLGLAATDAKTYDWGYFIEAHDNHQRFATAGWWKSAK